VFGSAVERKKETLVTWVGVRICILCRPQGGELSVVPLTPISNSGPSFTVRTASTMMLYAFEELGSNGLGFS
jgi:hypothetical protein